METMISIVMPTYNQGRYIQAAIESILAQTFTDFELIIVDDGSADGTPGVLSRITDPRVQVFHKRNGGTGSALNLGFSWAIGDLETWFASDNIMYPDCLATLHGFLKAHRDVDFVYSNCEIGVMDESGLKEIRRKNLLDEVKNQAWCLDRFATHYFLGICWLWRRPIREKCGGGWFQTAPCEDYDMTLRMAGVGGKFAHTPETLGWFRRHNQNMSQKIRGKVVVPTRESNLAKLDQIRRGEYQHPVYVKEQ